MQRYVILHMQTHTHTHSQIYIYIYICSAMSTPVCASAEHGEAWVQAVLMAHNERRSAHWTPPLATQLHNYTTLEVWGTEIQSILSNIENSSLITPYHTLSHLITPYHTLSHLITPYHTLSHLITPYHTLSHLLLAAGADTQTWTQTSSELFAVFTEKYDKIRKESVDLSRVANIRCGVRNATNMPGRKHPPEVASNSSNRQFHTIWLSSAAQGQRVRWSGQDAGTSMRSSREAFA